MNKKNAKQEHKEGTQNEMLPDPMADELQLIADTQAQ
jgi:hypothetical protein